MPQPTTTPSSEPRSLRLNDVAHMGAAKLQPLLQDSFRNLVTSAIADATGHLPRSSRKLLHGPHFCDDLVDALRWAEGEMKVACERMTWTKDPRAERTGRQLQQIRTALAQARAEEADRRRTEHRASAGHRVDSDPAPTARLWLRSAFPGRFEQLLAQEYATAQLEPRTERPGPADVFDAIEWGASEGYLFATMTPAVHDLLAKSPVAFRNTVAADAREQDERNVELRHPLRAPLAHRAGRTRGDDSPARRGHQRHGARPAHHRPGRHAAPSRLCCPQRPPLPRRCPPAHRREHPRRPPVRPDHHPARTGRARARRPPPRLRPGPAPTGR